MNTQKTMYIAVGVVIGIVAGVAIGYCFGLGHGYQQGMDDGGQVIAVTSFTDCEQAGFALQESYPRTCVAGGQSFTEDIGNALEKQNLIILDAPLPNAKITSPLTVTGKARGTWFFEASFPVVLTDWDGKIIAEGYAQAQGDWMTQEFVPFTSTLTFEKPSYGDRGSLILQKDNPSDLPEHDDALEIPVRF